MQSKLDKIHHERKIQEDKLKEFYRSKKLNYKSEAQKIDHNFEGKKANLLKKLEQKAQEKEKLEEFEKTKKRRSEEL